MNRRNVLRIGTIVILFLAGFGLGRAGQEQAEPTVETVTETVVETETIEVPVEVEVERVVEVEVERTPQVCLDAINSARGLFLVFADVMDAASDYPVMVGDAMQAGMDMDVVAAEQILNRMERAHEGIVDGRAEVEGSEFIDLARVCEAGS